MTPERREELRRAEDALITARYNLDRKSYLATIAAQEDRIKALESLLAEAVVEMQEYVSENPFNEGVEKIIDWTNRANAILPATEDKKDGD